MVQDQRLAGRINARNKWTGHLWQGRYGSVVMDEAHLMAAFAPALSRIADFRVLLDGTHEGQAFAALRGAEGTGRPIGNGSVLDGLEDRMGRNVLPAKRGSKVKVTT